MKRLTRDHIHHTFSPSHVPTLHVQQNENFVVETIDCFGGAITPDNPSADPPYHTLNAVTGPIYVEGAHVGDVLAVSIHDIVPEGVGVARCGTSSGQLARHVCRSKSLSDYTRFFDMDEERKVVTMRECTSCDGGTRNKRTAPISFPASPMLGVIGVAPSGGASVSIPTMPAGRHGGNLDDRMNRIGSTIFTCQSTRGLAKHWRYACFAR